MRESTLLKWHEDWLNRENKRYEKSPEEILKEKEEEQKQHFAIMEVFSEWHAAIDAGSTYEFRYYWVLGNSLLKIHKQSTRLIVDWWAIEPPEVVQNNYIMYPEYLKEKVRAVTGHEHFLIDTKHDFKSVVYRVHSWVSQCWLRRLQNGE